jgi:hypothetical protein
MGVSETAAEGALVVVVVVVVELGMELVPVVEVVAAGGAGASPIG